MIPKIIHFCWLSGEEYPALVKKCLETWKRVMPDYEIICWDQQRFDIESVRFVKEACSVKKWAFASDYIRFFALYYYGGIYLDSDVFVFKKFDRFLNCKVFSSVEYCLSSDSFTCNIEAATLGAEKGHVYMKKCLDYYKDRSFIKEDGSFDQTISPAILADIAFREYGFQRKPQVQSLPDGICIYSPHTFAHAYIEKLTLKDVYAIHLCEGGWYKHEKSSSWQTKALKKGHSFLKRFMRSPYKTLCMVYWHLKIRRMLQS